MKKLISRKMVLATIIATMSTSFIAFAQDPFYAPAARPEPIVLNEKMGYTMLEGTIQSIDENDGYTSIFLDNQTGGIIFNVANAFVLNSEDGSFSEVADLEEGEFVKVVLDNNAPMTMSLPPQTSGALGFVTGQGNVTVADFNEELVNVENTLMLNISEETSITSSTGSKQILTADDVKNSTVLAVYDTKTKSIPAQATPSAVVILEKGKFNVTGVETSEIMLISGSDIATMDETAENANTLTPTSTAFTYEVVAATVNDILKDEAGSIVGVELELDEGNVLVANTHGMTFVIDVTDSSLKTLEDITIGTQVNAIMNPNSPTTRSLPPQTNGVVGFTIGEGGFKVSNFDDNLISADFDVALNISEEAQILSTQGTRMILTAEDVKNKPALAVYAATTMSIPAQASPSLVLILDEIGFELEPEIATMDEVEILVPADSMPVDLSSTAVEMVSVRDIANEFGYEIKWTANTLPITLNKDSKEITFSLMTNLVTVDGEEFVVARTPELVDGKTFVPAGFAELLK